MRPKFRDHHLFDCLEPEAYGGLSLSTVQYAAVLKELAKIHGGFEPCCTCTAPDSDSSLDSNCTAVRKGNAYILNGRKHLITNARKADLFAIFCFTSNPALSPERQFSVLLVERGMCPASRSHPWLTPWVAPAPRTTY